MHRILFEIGPFTIYSYGVAVSAACLICSFMAVRDSADFGIPKDKFLDFLIYVFVSGIIGARLIHVFLNFNYYKDNPIQILMLHRGGLAIHGALIAGVLTGALFLLKNKLPLWSTGDLMMPYVALGQAIGRIGCFLNGCCYGRLIESTGFRHPTQLYSSATLFIIFIILRILNKKRRFDGQTFFTYFLMYAPARFVIDFLRGDLTPVFMGLTVSQLISLILFIAAFSVYYFKKR